MQIILSRKGKRKSRLANNVVLPAPLTIRACAGCKQPTEVRSTLDEDLGDGRYRYRNACKRCGFVYGLHFWDVSTEVTQAVEARRFSRKPRRRPIIVLRRARGR